MTWSRSLSDLGYGAEIRAAGLEGELALDWPLPDASPDLTGHLELSLSALVTAGFTAVIEIFVNGHGFSSLPLAAGSTHRTLSLKLPPETLKAGPLHVELRFAAAASQSRCRDQRLGGITLAIDPHSALSLTAPAPQNAKEALALLPAEIGVALPEGPLTVAAYRDVLMTAASLAKAGHRFVTRPPDKADLLFSRAATTPALAADGRLILPLRSTEAAKAHAIPFGEDEASITLAALGADMSTREVSTQTEWSFALPASEESRPTALALSLSHGIDAPGIHHAVHLFVNGGLAASMELPAQLDEPLVLPMPAGLLGFSDRATLRFERMSPRGCLDGGAPVPVALGRDTRLLLGKPEGPARQFFEIAHAAETGLSLYLPTAYFSDPGASLPFLAAMLKRYWTAGTPLNLHLAGEAAPAPSHPFIFIANAPPRTLVLPLQSGPSVVLIESRNKQPVMNLARDEGGYAALALWGDREGIFIVPLKGSEPLPNRFSLEHGNLAVFDSTGVALWLSTEAPRGLSLRYADTAGLDAPFAKLRLFGVAVLWCVLTLATLIALARHGRRR